MNCWNIHPIPQILNINESSCLQRDNGEMNSTAAIGKICSLLAAPYLRTKYTN